MSKRFAVAIALVLAAASSASAAKVTRTVLKEYFQNGDIPDQNDFADLIDSLVHYTDDRDFIGLRTYDPTATYGLGDTVVFNNSIYLANTSTAPGDFLDFTTNIEPGTALSDLNFDMATHFGGQHGYLEFEMGNSLGRYFGYMQITMAPVGPGETNPSFFVEYLAYEDTPFASMQITELPEPASLVCMSGAAMLLLRRRRR